MSVPVSQTTDRAHSVWIERERALTLHLATHHQAISSAELAALGYERNDITRLCARKRLVRIRRGAYRCGSAAFGGDTELRCALLNAGIGAGLTGQMGAHLLGLLAFRPWVIDVVIEGDPGRRRRRGVVIHRVESLPASDLLEVRGLPCTTPQRTLIEFAAAMGSPRTNRRFPVDQRALRRALREATVLDHGLPARLEAALKARTGQRGNAILRGLLGEHLTDTLVLRSNFETDFFGWCAEVGLPPWETNATVLDFEVDVLFRDQRVIVELDTFRYHGDERAFEGDRERDSRLHAADYRVLRFTARRFAADRAGVLLDLRTALGLV